MSCKIVGWLDRAWDGKNSEFRKNLHRKKIFELNRKGGIEEVP